MKCITKLLVLSFFKLFLSVEFDPLGYIVYCPCMGRFGNQADHFLGALGFAHGLNRTLVLPPWVEYRYGEPKSIQVAFDTYFKEEPLKKYHKIISMKQFMTTVAPYEWPEYRRIAFCYMARGSGESCNAKEGNPFGPFWDTFNIDFVGSEFYSPLHYDVYHYNMAQQWKERYPPSIWSVLAFTGAPASFPVQLENRGLQKYLEWSDSIEDEANEFIRKNMPTGAFVGIHLRNGIDWVRACEHIPESPNLFAAAQCVGYQNEKGKATSEMCLPSKDTIIRQLKRVIKSINNLANNNNDRTIKSLYVASDSYHMLDDLKNALKRMKVYVFKHKKSSPHVDLAILDEKYTMYSRKDFLLIRPWQQQKFENHRSKVQSALPAIDTSPPAYRGHVVTKLKKKQMEHERCRKIERDNYLLLQKMNYIMKTSRVDNFWSSPQPILLNRMNMYNTVGPEIEDTLYDSEDTENRTSSRKSKCCAPLKKDKVIEEEIQRKPTMKPISRSKSVPIRTLKSSPITKENTALSSGRLCGSAKANTKSFTKTPNTKKKIINLKEKESITFSKGSLKLTVNFPTDTTVEFQEENTVKLFVNDICHCKNSPTVVM